jgi:two-component system, NtrC family, response regulator HydG
MPNPAILVIDDDPSITTTLSSFLKAKGYNVAVANDSDDALEVVAAGQHRLILCDIYIDRLTGLDILRAARERDPDTRVILMTARGSIGTTVEAETGGAFDYLAKPLNLKDLLAVIERATRDSAAPAEQPPTEDLQEFGGMIGFAPAMVEVYKRIARFAKSDETVLILGESGVGKELVAKAIHDHSKRSEKPFVALDSGAVAGSLWEAEVFGALKGAFTGADRDRPGVIDAAQGGTVFFDEIAEIPLEFQAKLLRFLQEKEYRPVGSNRAKHAEVRVLAATNRDLEEMVRRESFRADLLYRLNVLRIEVPPLRSRRSDIPFLVKRILDEACGKVGKKLWLVGGASDALAQYEWPGNVRQLQNVIRRLVAMEPPGAIPEEAVRRELEAGEAEDEATGLDAVERQHIQRVLEQTEGNKTKAAEILGIQRRTLYKKLARMQRDDAEAGE